MTGFVTLRYLRDELVGLCDSTSACGAPVISSPIATFSSASSKETMHRIETESPHRRFNPVSERCARPWAAASAPTQNKIKAGTTR
jgi:hypothetical protein